MNREVRPKFIADVMLGSLSRWLRLFGFDTLYSNNCSDKDLIRISVQENRILLTKDNNLSKNKLLKQVLLINSEEIREQIKEVFKYIGISKNYFSLTPRCAVCNGETEIVDKEEISSQIPEFVYFTKDIYRRCKKCNKVYWYGSHMDNIERIKKEIFDEFNLK